MDNPFGRLPGDSVTEILSRTSPLDVSRFAVISKGFKAAADSDAVWDRFIPTDIVSRSHSPVVVYDTKKGLFLGLCDSPILLDGGNLSFSLDKRSGKKCFMIGARELIISGANAEPYLKWTSHENSRFSEVVHLNFVRWFDIRGKINTRMLSQKTSYSAYLVYQVKKAVYGIGSVFAEIRLVNQEADKDAAKRTCLLYLHTGYPNYRIFPVDTGKTPAQRGDGWFEIPVGEFYNDEGDNGEEEARRLEIWHLHGNSDLIVEGIEFRPNPSFAKQWRIPDL